MYVLLVRREARRRWPVMVLMFAVATLVFLPLGIWLLKHPGAESRIGEVREPLDRLLAGDPTLVLENLGKNLGMFTVSGDPWPRQNLPGRPVFASLLTAALFYAGVVVALLRWRSPQYGSTVIWLGVALGPSIVTSVAPSSIRNILGLVATFVFPALSITALCRWLRQQSSWASVPAMLLRRACFPGAIIVLALTGGLTIRDYFILWPRNEVVRFDYQTDLTAVAQRLDTLPEGANVAVAGLSVHTMDGPTVALTARRGITGVRLSDTRETLVVPSGPHSWVLVPTIVPFDPDLEERLSRWTVERQRTASYTAYRLSGDRFPCEGLSNIDLHAWRPSGAAARPPVSYGGLLIYLGHERSAKVVPAGGRLTVLTYWCVEYPALAPLKVFVHLTGYSDRPIAQSDGLASPPQGWTSGDLIIQEHAIALPIDLEPGWYGLEVGLYHPDTGHRLVVSGADRLFLAAVEVSGEETS
jgi:hypothetical protein